MNILLRIYKFFMIIVNFFLELLPRNSKKIIILSRQDDKPSIDLTYIINDINKRYPEYKVKVLAKRMVKTNIIEIIKYVLHPFIQLYYLATSGICIIDGYQMAVSAVNHGKGLRVIQIWHSLGAIKKFGYQTLKTKKEIEEAKIMHMHRNYDAIISGSDEMTKYFSLAFNYPEEKFVSLGLPRTDYLKDSFKDNQKKVYSIYPNLKNKKVILYAPTFRKYDKYKVDELIKVFKDTDYELIIKKHPRMNVDVPSSLSYDEVSSLELLSVASFVITDYSAISIEAAILDIPVMLYVYNYELYDKEEGINTNLYEDLKGYVFEDEKELYKEIIKDKYNMNVLKKYKEKYVSNVKGNRTEKIVDFIIGGPNEDL